MTFSQHTPPEVVRKDFQAAGKIVKQFLDYKAELQAKIDKPTKERDELKAKLAEYLLEIGQKYRKWVGRHIYWGRL
jgi:hypothetical protein